MIRFGHEICGNLEQALTKEWLETNGLGGFASSTILGLNTRRYHGLLTAATKPPLGRLALLSKLEETCLLNGRRFDLSTNHYEGAVYPNGFHYLKEFRLDPIPTFTYEIDGLEIVKRIFMVHGENTTVLEYQLGEGKAPCWLELRPLIAFRDYHNTTHANQALDPSVESLPGCATVQPYPDLPKLYFAHEADQLEDQSQWYYQFAYPIEQERGLDFHEDLFQPFLLRFDCSRRSIATVVVSTEPRDVKEVTRLRVAEIERRGKVLDGAPSSQPLVRALTAAADQFIVQRGNLKTVIAGYHWFGDWGRDTMMALPGLTLTTGRAEIAKSILLAFAQHVDRGMLPNRFPDAGEGPEYNTVDATLWFFEALRALVEHTGDHQFIQERFYDLLQDIVDWHVRGTRYGIGVDNSGLLNAGEPGIQLTWMDAKIGGWVVTPRHGKPVEIQALWYNALRVMQKFAEGRSDSVGRKLYASMAENARHSFRSMFWNEESKCLYDVVNGDFRDGSMRPNQILAVSLPYSMLDPPKARWVVEAVQSQLLTPRGLRTLAPSDAQYRAHYEGDPERRDSAYHQGTVWPWLLGPFLKAYLKVHRRSRRAQAQAEQWLSAYEAHLSEAGLGQVSEIFDADPPHRARGCIAQAWSVAELLRVAVEDVYRPD